MSCFSPGILYRTVGSEGYFASRLQKTFCFVPFQGSWAGQLSLSFVRTAKCPQNSLSIHAKATGPAERLPIAKLQDLTNSKKTIFGSQHASGASFFEATSNLNVQLPHKEFWLLPSVPCQVPFDTSMCKVKDGVRESLANTVLYLYIKVCIYIYYIYIYFTAHVYCTCIYTRTHIYIYVCMMYDWTLCIKNIHAHTSN